MYNHWRHFNISNETSRGTVYLGFFAITPSSMVKPFLCSWMYFRYKRTHSFLLLIWIYILIWNSNIKYIYFEFHMTFGIFFKKNIHCPDRRLPLQLNTWIFHVWWSLCFHGQWIPIKIVRYPMFSIGNLLTWIQQCGWTIRMCVSSLSLRYTLIESRKSTRYTSIDDKNSCR